MGLAAIRRYYGVPAKRGQRIKFTWAGWTGAREGTITGTTRSAMHLRLRMDDGRRILAHPTWELEYIGSAP